MASLAISKLNFNVNEILSTIMMNAIAVQLMNFLLQITIDTMQQNACLHLKPLV
ncbi:MAG: hypothetical protein R2865_09655 [Deinococcales bacterium]